MRSGLAWDRVSTESDIREFLASRQPVRTIAFVHRSRVNGLWEGPRRIIAVCAAMQNAQRRRRWYRLGRWLLPVRQPASRGTGARPA